MKKMTAIILAAGKGTRMKSDVPKVLHKILGKSAICYILDSLKGAGIKDIVTVVGYGKELLADVVDKQTKIIIQKKLLGSGDAVKSAGKALRGYSGDVLIICGDTPLVGSRTLKEIAARHASSGASMTILTVKLKDPTGYGRILRSSDGKILKIIEEENARLYEEKINEVNVGTYCFNTKDLFEALKEVGQNNKKKEFFLTDTIEILNKKGKKLESVLLENPEDMTGINTRRDLAGVTGVLKNRILDELMLSGVTIEDPASTVIYGGVRIGRDTVICPNTVIESDVEIGAHCRIGPFARIRPDVKIGDGAEVGNFVELVRTEVGSGAKIKHHTYLGDTKVGRNVNIGAGTITANFDGKNKNRTVIEDGAFIGIGARLVAPVRIGRGAIIGAGAVVLKNHNVPKAAVAVGVPARIIRKKK